MRKPDRGKLRERVLFERLEQRVLLDADPSLHLEVDYLVIAGDDFFSSGQPCSAIQELERWKEVKGFRTHVASVSQAESNAGGIRDYVFHGKLNEDGEWWDAPPKFILLIGDQEQVPAGAYRCRSDNYATHVTDIPYADMKVFPYECNLPDRAIGRIPVDTVAEADCVIHKILQYDRTPFVPTTPADNWYNDALVAAYFDDLLSPDGIQDSWMLETAMHVYQYLESEQNMEMHDVLTADGPVNSYNTFGYPRRSEVLSKYDPFLSGGLEVPAWVQEKIIGGSASGQSELQTAINAGVGLVQYRDHGEFRGQFTGSSGDSLLNWLDRAAGGG